MGANQQGADATQGRWVTIPRTLCFVFNGDDVLLMRRASHKRVFPNQYNGLGGHVERDEDPYTSARREIREESGLEVTDLTLRAVYNIDTGKGSGILLFVFTANSLVRSIEKNTDEGILRWVPRREVFQLNLVEDLPHILPRIFEMKLCESPLFVHVSYDERDQIRMRFAE